MHQLTTIKHKSSLHFFAMQLSWPSLAY